MKIPRISIITPSFNQGGFIRKTIESVLLQDYPNIEYIVMDGGSTDQTISILESFNRKFQIPNSKFQKKTFHWLSRKDRGQADAINKGLQRATGNILCYLNSDDYMEPHAVSKVMEVFQKKKDVMWLTGDCRIVDADGKEIQSFIRLYKKVWRYIPISWVLPILNPIAQPSTFWRKKVVDEVGYFNETRRYVFDYEYWIRLSKRYPPIVLPLALSSFRIHKQSKGGVEYKKQFEEETMVSKQYYKSSVSRFLHRLHAQFTVWAYNRIK